MLRKKRLYHALSEAILPVHMTIEDESSNHRRPGVETHFTVLAVSEKFEGLSRLARHRLVNAAVEDEFKTGLHALSLHLYTLKEWDKRGNPTPTVPRCHNKQQRP
ncbi:MAG: BolA family transcriptional regulator [Legionellaceae bacterium]|nr:BolA family transcriptional regulator [Legionellaceae bacterium]